MMEYVTLGNTGIQVSKICLGTMTFGEQNIETEGHEQMDYALDQGIQFFDTAEMYSVPARKETQGSTERILGTWFRSRKNRDKVVLATKITGPSPTFKFLRDPLNYSEAQIREALEGSLSRLQTDYVDLYQLHWPERKMNMFGKRGFEYDPSDPWTDNFLDVIRVMDALIREGRIRAWGVSNENAWGLMRILHLADLHGLPRPVSIQNPYSLLNRLFEVGLAEASIREQVGLLAYSPMAFGVLSGKYDDQQADVSNSRLTLFKQYSRYSSAPSREAAREYARIAKEAGLRPSQMALAFVNRQPFVTSNIIGATTMAQLKENIESIHVSLSPDVLRAIEETHRRIPDPAP